MAGRKAPKRARWIQELSWRVEVLLFDVASGFLRLLPVDAASAIGGALLRTLGPLTSAQRTVDRNLRIAFPQMSAEERKRISIAQWEGMGRTFAELPLMDRLTPENGRVEIVGRERLDEVVRGGVPTIFFSGHFSNYEIMAAVVVQAGVQGPLTYRATNNPYFDKRITESRRRYGVSVFAAKGVDAARALYQSLARGHCIGIMVDQKFNFGVAQATFFGERAPTNPGPVRLALRANARFQPLSVVRLKGARFRMTFHEPIELPRTGDRGRDVEEGVRRMNDFIEARVRERPEEYFWAHRRWGDEVYAALAKTEAEAGA